MVLFSFFLDVYKALKRASKVFCLLCIAKCLVILIKFIKIRII